MTDRWQTVSEWRADQQRQRRLKQLVSLNHGQQRPYTVYRHGKPAYRRKPRRQGMDAGTILLLLLLGMILGHSLLLQ